MLTAIAQRLHGHLLSLATALLTLSSVVFLHTTLGAVLLVIGLVLVVGDTTQAVIRARRAHARP